MDLVSDHPFWAVKNGLLRAYPALEGDADCDVLILGAGISGALVAERMTREGLDVLMLDGRDVAQGSTAASTSLLQYEIDVHLVDLIALVGLDHAQRAYQLCLKSILDLEQLAGTLPIDCGFQRQQSLYVASRKRDVAALKDEADARRAAGIEVTLLDSEAIQQEFSLEAPAALHSPLAAVCDAYRFAHGLLQLAQARGARVHDRTAVTNIRHTRNGIEARTERGGCVRSRWVVHATGYEAAQSLAKKVVSLKSTYALVTQPLSDIPDWLRCCVFWESARPYLYLRSTDDGRILAGGEDDDFHNPGRRDRSIHRKSERILKRLSKLLPDLKLECEYAWAGTFGETKDGLGYIGPHPRQPKALYALGFGGNGITFSQIAADILTDIVLGRSNADTDIFRFERRPKQDISKPQVSS